MWLATVRHPPQPIATHCHNTRWEPWLWVPNPCTTNTSRAVMCLSPSSLVQFWPKPCFVISQSTAASNMLPSSIPFLKSASNLILPSRRTKAQRSNKAFFFFFLSKIVFFHVPSISSPTEPLCHYHVPRAPHSPCSVPPPCCCMHLACTARFTIVLYPHCLVL